MNQTTINDILNKSLLSLQSNPYGITPLDILLNLTVTLLCSIFIYYIYRKTFKGVLYQQTFGISLVAISLIVTLVIMTISGNLILSLGMVGALSIVRFRTPLKDPLDLVFIFWALTVGIANGVGYFSISVIGSLFIAIILYYFSTKKESLNTYLLIIKINADTNVKEIFNILKKDTLNFQLKSKTKIADKEELVYEIRLDDKNTEKIYKRLEKLADIKNLTILNFSSNLENS